MAPLIDMVPVAKLGWAYLIERRWSELRGAGFPAELIDLARDIGQHNERPIRVYTLPTLEAGVAGLAVPFIHEDGLLFDPCLLDRAGDLRSVVSRELAHLLYPGWEGLAFEEEYDDVQVFVRILAPKLLGDLPRMVAEVEPVVAAALAVVRAA